MNTETVDPRQLRNALGRFAIASADKSAGVSFATGHWGFPVLPGSIAVFECQTKNTVGGADHLIFIGRVAAAAYGDGEPLVFSSGRYCVPMPHSSTAVPTAVPEDLSARALRR